MLNDKKRTSLIILALIVVIIIAIGTVSIILFIKNDNFANINKDTAISDNNQQTNNKNDSNIPDNKKQEILNGTAHKVPGKKIYVDVPNWTPMELTNKRITTVYKIQGSKYVSITSTDDKVNSLSEAYQKTFEAFKENIDGYHTIYSVSITSEKTEKINNLEVYRFEGSMNCRAPNNVSVKYDAYVVGYSFIFNGSPCSIIGSVQSVEQEKSIIKEMRETVDEMIKTVRAER